MTEFNNLIKNSIGFMCLGAVSEKEIDNAEQELNLKFNSEYHDYLLEYGVATTDQHEFTGICLSQRLNVVFVTQEYREINKNIPSNWYVIEKSNIDDVVIWQSSRGKVYQTIGLSKGIKIADSMIEYILETEEQHND